MQCKPQRCHLLPQGAISGWGVNGLTRASFGPVRPSWTFPKAQLVGKREGGGRLGSFSRTQNATERRRVGGRPLELSGPVRDRLPGTSLAPAPGKQSGAEPVPPRSPHTLGPPTPAHLETETHPHRPGGGARREGRQAAAAGSAGQEPPPRPQGCPAMATPTPRSRGAAAFPSFCLNCPP